MGQIKTTAISVILLTVIYFATIFAALERTSLTNGNTHFATRLLQELAKSNDGDILFSPLSIHTLLSLIYQESGGNTQKTLAKVLNTFEIKEKSAQGYKQIMSDLDRVSNVTLHIANKIFVKDGLERKNSFEALARDNFFAEAEKVNVDDSQGTPSKINDWIKEKANKKTNDLITQDITNPLTAMVLVNAIYFKGNWAKPFPKELTRKKTFNLSDTETVEVDMMHQKSNFKYGISTVLDAMIVEFPYKDKQLSMFVILPHKVDGIKQVEQKLANINLGELFSDMREGEVTVEFPKFKIESKIILNDVLKKLGLEIIFSNEADFSGLLEDPVPLKVDKAIHEIFLEVNEEGSEVAAATGISMTSHCSASELGPEFTVDRAFIIVLQAQDQIIFVGSIRRPS